ncbi:unnamed protein product [Amoebophrya sp. A25]|nr:unnamed protein product [Amoebophrya sp. A25]|eukprot:GSA25T00018104001.1
MSGCGNRGWKIFGIMRPCTEKRLRGSVGSARANAQSTTLVSSALSTASGSPTGTAASYLGNAVGQAFGGVGAVGQALSSGWADPRSFTAQLTSSAAVQKLVANARDRKCAPPSMPAPFS